MNNGPGSPVVKPQRPGCGLYTPLILLALLAGCGVLPTKTERRLFEIQTNFATVTVTNVRTETVTNAITVTNVFQGTNTVVLLTNLVSPVIVTNYATNLTELYTYTPKPEVVQLSGLANLIPGYGQLAALLLAGGLGLWGKMRSTAASKAERAGVALAQVIETGRQILKQTPQGAQLESAWLAFMQKHQIATDTAGQVLNFLQEINTPAAQIAAERIAAGLPVK